MKRSRWTPVTLLATGCAWASDLRWRAALALLAAALSSANVRAEPVPSQPLPPPPIGARSPSAAVGWSLLATAVPVIVGVQMMGTGISTEEDQQKVSSGALLVLGGAIAGPSAGYFYGGCPSAGWTGTLGRAVVGAVGLTSAFYYVASDGGDVGYAYPSLVGSSLIILAWDAWDLARVGGRVREANEQRARTATLAPRVIPVALDHGRAPGLAVSVKF